MEKKKITIRKLEPPPDTCAVLSVPAKTPKQKIIIKKETPVSGLSGALVSTQVSPNATIPVHPEPIDLLASSNIDINNDNKIFIDQFKLLAKQIEYQILWSKEAKEKTKHRFRLQQINKAIDIFENHPGKIPSGTVAQKIKGIGKGIGNRIDEILQTGTLVELTEKKFVSELTETIKELTQVTGIGEVRARQLIENFGVKSVADLKQKVAAGQIKVAKNQLTHHMMVGLKYYDDILKKIPRAEIQEIEVLLLDSKNQIDPKLMLQICGSYRRERPFSGDIDVLMTHPDLITEDQVKTYPRKYLLELLELLTNLGFIVDNLTDKGHTKYMGVCRLGKDGIHRRIDVRFVPYDSWAPALMYFTGSMQFNKISRGIANSRDLTLNEYGLFHFKDRKKGEKIPVFTEEDIFKVIGINYLTPKQRDL